MPEPRASQNAPLQWIRPPRQARTQEVLVRLLDAARALLEEKGFEDMSVSEVALRAGTSVGALYRRFPDKEGLLHALHERFCVEAIATADAALTPERWEGVAVEEILAETIGFLTHVYRDNQALDRAIYQRALANERFRERSARLQRHVLSGLASLLLARRDEFDHPDPQLAVDMALRQVLGVLVEHFVFGFAESGIVRVSDDVLARELTRSCLRYLGVRESGASA